MAIAVTTTNKYSILTTLIRIKSDFGIVGTNSDIVLNDAIRTASDAVERYCARTFTRQIYTETVPGFGGLYYDTHEAPIVILASTTLNGDTITDVSIQDRENGILYRQAGFTWTAQRFPGLVGTGRWLQGGSPIPMHEEPSWVFKYTGGYIVPSWNQLSIGSISVATATGDDSFDDGDSGFPPLLKADDVIETSGFSNEANNGRFIVTGTPTTAKITVSADLATETTATGRDMRVATLPYDVEQGVVETVKALFGERALDSNLVQRTAGPLSLRYSETKANEQLGIPPAALGYLKPWVRVHDGVG